MRIHLDLNDLGGYRTFLKIKALPAYQFHGREAWFPDEYAARLGVDYVPETVIDYKPKPWLFDYQRDVARLALRKRKFAAFWDCGLGKQNLAFEFARSVLERLPQEKAVLLICPLMVIPQAIEEARKFYGDELQIEQVRARDLPKWMVSGEGRFGITNYDALTDSVPQGRIGALILDESSSLKSSSGVWAGHCLRLGSGLDWKLCLTGTPAPNDRIEYANHAVFLDHYPTVNSFLAKFFVNKGNTGERWELKKHAVGAFFLALSHWSIFLTNPATYGWTSNCGNIPPIHVHIHEVGLTAEQIQKARDITGTLFAGVNPGGIGSRSKLARIAKSEDGLKPQYIRELIDSWRAEESTIVWCRFNDEQDILARILPDSASISGKTKEEERLRIINDFKAGRVRTLITKSEILGYGLNLQICTRQVFSSLIDSFELFHQSVKRSNRVGSTRPLNVHIPITEVERPMVENVLQKAHRVQEDTEEQERVFKKMGIIDL